MQLADAYSVIVTERLQECRDFYVRWFGFEVGFEASWIVWLTTGGERPVSLSFMSSRAASRKRCTRVSARARAESSDRATACSR